MKLRKAWYMVLALMPIYGIVNAIRDNYEPWIGLLAGALVSSVLLGITEGFRHVMRKYNSNSSPNHNSLDASSLDAGIAKVPSTPTVPSSKKLNRSQALVLYLWLGVAAVLSLFPPFLVEKTTMSSTPFSMGGEIRHGFILSGGETIVNVQFLGGTTDASRIPHVVSKQISLPTLLSELILVSALFAGLFIYRRKP